MRIPSGVTDQYIYFVAVDDTDGVTRETGLSSFTVYRSRDGAAAVAMTTPTINETDATNMPGVYELLLDEDMTIGAGNGSEEMVFHITATGMRPVTRSIELYRPHVSPGSTLLVNVGGDLGTSVITNATIAADAIGSSELAASAVAEIADAVWDEAQSGHTTAGTFGELATEIAAILVDTGTTLDGKIDTIDGIVDAILLDTAEIGAAGAGLTEAGGTGDHLSAVPWNASWDAEVQSEVEDALTAARAEPTGVPAANESLVGKVDRLYMMARNQTTITATKKTFYDDAGNAEFEKDLSDDGTTYTETEVNAI